MKIAFQAMGFGLNDNHGGAAVVASKNAIKLASRGHEITFFCTNTIDKTEKKYDQTTYRRIKGVNVVYLKTYTIYFWPGSFGPSYTPNLTKYLDQGAPFDIVHLTEYRSFLALCISKWAIKNKIPFTIQPLGSMIMGGKNVFIKRLYDLMYCKDVLGKSAMVIPVTNKEKSLAIEMGVNKSNIKVIPQGIDIENYKDLPQKGNFREKYNIPPNKHLVLFVGRLDKIKGIDILIEGYAGIMDDTNILVIIGPDHGYINEIKKLINKLKIKENILLTGALSDFKDVLSAMNDADVLVVPSRAEAFGMVILEGAVLKKSMVISENCNVSDEFVDSSIVTPIQPQLIGCAIVKILKNQALGKELGTRAYNKVVEKFQLNKVVDEFELLFTTLVSSNQQ